ncbi:enoyl-CoA hydratase/isomerase domain protein, partial [Bordetella bronchiseptica GA96-01]
MSETDTNPEHYARYRALRIRRHPEGILELVMGAKDASGKLSTADERLHRELADVWRDIDTDDQTRVVVIRGEGNGFSGGGDLGLVQQMAEDFEVRTRVWREARDLVYNIINCNKPIVS